jgi:hypothetical protein
VPRKVNVDVWYGCACRKSNCWRLIETPAMLPLVVFVHFGTVIDLLRSRVTLEAEILVLRQQINVLRRASPKRLSFRLIDRLILGGVCRLFPEMYGALAIVRPDTVIRWHRAGFRLHWRSKSRRRCGRPPVSLEIRRLIREMSIANPLWGAPVPLTPK